MLELIFLVGVSCQYIGELRYVELAGDKFFASILFIGRVRNVLKYC